MYRNDDETPTLDALKNLNHKKTEPVKRIGPKVDAALEGEEAPKTNADRLIGIAKDNEVNGVGKLTLAEARFELRNDTLLLKDVEALIHQFYPAVEVEPRPHNTLHLHFSNAKRRVIPAVSQLPPKKVIDV